MPEGNITLKSKNDSVEIKGGRSIFKLLGLAANDYPSLPETGNIEFFDVDASILSKMIDRTSFSISTDETRPHLNGSFFQGDGKILRMVTTDGHRLTKAEFKSEESGFYNFSMVIPQKGVLEIRKLLDESDSTVAIGYQEDSIFLKLNIEIEKATEKEPAKTAEFILSSKLIDSEFPPYDKVIPPEQEKKIIVSRTEINDALKRISIVSLDKTLGFKLALSEGVIEISSDNPAIGESSEIIDVNYEGEEVEIGFNAKYFIDIFNVMPDDELLIEMGGPLEPAVIKDFDQTFVGVIMPMKI
jgi:DNA polymerase-3 subunit beta